MVALLRYAADRDGYPYLAQLSTELLWITVWLAIAFCAIHVIRRARSTPAAKPPAGYNWNQRLYHWGNFLLLAVVALSGYWLFVRRTPQAPFGLTWLEIHSWSGLIFAGGVIFHAVSATVRGDWRAMRPELRDFRDGLLIWKNFLGRTTAYPTAGKYDALQKIYHHILSLLAVAFTVSGVWMWLSAERIHLAGRGWLHFLRIIHDASAFALAAMVIGHFYFSIIKANRANLKDMAGVGVEQQPENKAAD
jgi:cytochrome b subunit of formate dehydrogenase